jgi:hypothetical protein
MKKIILLIIVTLALGLSGMGCNKSSGKLDTTSKFTAPSGPIEFKLKWPVGERIVQSLDLKQNSEISVPMQPNPIKQEMTMGQTYGLSVLKETADGGREVEMEFLSMRMNIAQGGKSMVDYDSAKKAPADNSNPVAGIFKKMIGVKIKFVMDASNQVQRVEGLDELSNRLTTGGRGDASAMFKSMFNEGYFKQMMDHSQNLPPKPVQPGDTWPVKREIMMGDLGAMVMAYDFTFQSWEQHGKRTCARLDFQGTVKSRPGQAPAPNGMNINIQDGNTSGTSWFDPELGMFIDSTFNQDIKMTMTMPMGGRGKAAGQTMTMTNNMSQVISIKLDSVK